MNKNIITPFVLGTLMLFAASPALASTTSTTTPQVSASVSCMKAATTKEISALKQAKKLVKLSARKAAIKAAQQQFNLDRKACK